MSDIFEDEGPAHRNTINTSTGVSVFVELSAEGCKLAPDGKHDWSGERISTGDGETTTCTHCGMSCMDWCLRYLP